MSIGARYQVMTDKALHSVRNQRDLFCSGESERALRKRCPFGSERDGRVFLMGQSCFASSPQPAQEATGVMLRRMGTTCVR